MAYVYVRAWWWMSGLGYLWIKNITITTVKDPQTWIQLEIFNA